MGFKDIVKNDIKNVFLNFDEFATKHTINGKELLAVVDEDTSTERSITDVNNIYYGSKLLYVAVDDLGFKPVIEGNIRLDNVMYQVNNITESMGVYEITLAAYVGR